MKTIKIGGYAEPCKTCRWVQDGGFCGNGNSKYFDMSKSDGVIGDWCQDWEERTAEQLQEAAALALVDNVGQLGRYLTQMGQMMAALQRRLDEMEARQEKITVSHAEVKKLQGLIRARADEICRKYELGDRESPKLFRAAIKKDLLKRYQVKDLHDLPAASLGGAEEAVGRWVNIRMAMERRGSA